jgi:hypothetical protein
MSNRSEPWQPPRNGAPPPPGTMSGTISIQDIMNIYAFLNTITTPSEAIAKAKANMENIILDFTSSLGSRQQ